jgi:two-component system, OmpR family, response regulator
MTIEKVLLVDDEPDIRAVAKIALGAVGGWQVVVCESGTEAIAQAAAEAPDIILLDVMMPEMDGPTTFKKLREQASTASIPIIFLTAKVQPQEIQAYLDLGAVGVINKPFDPMTLATQVKGVVENT